MTGISLSLYKRYEVNKPKGLLIETVSQEKSSKLQHVFPSTCQQKSSSFLTQGSTRDRVGHDVRPPAGPPLAPKNRFLSPGVVQWRPEGEALRPEEYTRTMKGTHTYRYTSLVLKQRSSL